MAELTPQQQKFVEEYLVDGNAAAAYRRAGYVARNDNVAAAAASRLLRNVKIEQALVKARQVQMERLAAEGRSPQIRADRVLEEFARVAFSDPRKLYRPDGTLKPPSEWDDETAASIASVETDESVLQVEENSRLTTRTHKVKRWDKLRALKHLGDHLRLFDQPEKPPEKRRELVVNFINFYGPPQHLPPEDEPRRVDLDERGGGGGPGLPPPPRPAPGHEQP